jgi:hypothetical protein
VHAVGPPCFRAGQSESPPGGPPSGRVDHPQPGAARAV